MRLPNGDKAIVDPRKLLDYCLNPTHESGKHKARVFASALGVTRHNWEILRDELLSSASTCEATYKGRNNHGDRYEVRFMMETFAGRAEVLSAWIIWTGESEPRLVSCYVISGKAPK